MEFERALIGASTRQEVLRGTPISTKAASPWTRWISKQTQRTDKSICSATGVKGCAAYETHRFAREGPPHDPHPDPDGGDAKGEHLVIFRDGKFGCVVNGKDKARNRKILTWNGCDDTRWERGTPLT